MQPSDAVAALVQANVGPDTVKYLIWCQRYWEAEGRDVINDRSSPTQNNTDHVNDTVNEGRCDGCPGHGRLDVRDSRRPVPPGCQPRTR